MFDSTSPWETSQAVGGDLTGTLTADRASGPTYAEALAPTPPVQETLPKQVASLGALQAEWQASKEQSEPFFKKLTINPQTGQVDISTTQGALADVFAQLKDLQTMKTAAMARVAQLRQQEASGSPLIDALSQISGHLAANDPTMPGWVRALGAANLQMGPQGIKRERMMEEERVAGLAGQITKTALESERLSEYRATVEAKTRGEDLERRRVEVAERAQAATERNQIEDNYRSDLRPIYDVIGRTGIFNADHETAIRKAAANHPGLKPEAVESEIAKARANAAATKAEIERKTKQRMAEISQRMSLYGAQLAAQEGKQIRGQVLRSNLAQASEMAKNARIDEKEALRLQGLNEMAIAADRMQADLESDPTWQGVLAGRVAETAQLTTAQQQMISNSAGLFVKKMSSLGISFAKTSDAEMRQILATVPRASMTVAQAKRLLQIINDEGQRATAFIASRNWAESPESLAAALPEKYRDAGLNAHAQATSRLSPQKRLAYGLATGDEEMVRMEVERAISGAPGTPMVAPAQPRPHGWAPKVAQPKGSKDDPEGLLDFLPRR